MKVCPQCQNTYTDDNLKYCLQDGTPLVDQSDSQADWSESETVVSPKTQVPAQVTWQNPPTADWSHVTGSQSVAAPEKSRTGLLIALTALLTLIVIGGAIAGYLIYQRSQKVETAQNNNGNSKSANANVNQKTNAGVNANAAPSPTATPTPKPTLNPKDAEEVRADVKTVIDLWESSVTDHDLDGHLANYAPTVDFYNAGKVPVARVRADREKAFAIYDNMKASVDNLKITPDETGEKAAAVFDKEWDFSSEEKSSTGKVQQQLTLSKINGEWLITGEKDLKVYYKN